MNYRNEKHRIAFIEAIEKLNRKDYALMSAVYLLTAEHALWMIADRGLIRPRIFDLICNAMAIRRFGLGAINFTLERKQNHDQSNH